jgi:tryptophan 2,3-dioxygenase
MQTTFAEVLEKIESFSFEEKETLVDILQHRIIEQRRKEILKEVKNAEDEFEQGLCKPMSVDEFMQEALS